MKLKHGFVCKECRTQYNILSGSYFKNIHVLHILWLWSAECNSGIATIIINVERNSILWNETADVSFHKQHMNMGTATSSPNAFRKAWSSSTSRWKHDTKRNYHRGRIVQEKWIWGMYDTSAKWSIVTYIPYQKSTTLLEKKYG